MSGQTVISDGERQAFHDKSRLKESMSRSQPYGRYWREYFRLKRKLSTLKRRAEEKINNVKDLIKQERAKKSPNTIKPTK